MSHEHVRVPTKSFASFSFFVLNRRGDTPSRPLAAVARPRWGPRAFLRFPSFPSSSTSPRMPKRQNRWTSMYFANDDGTRCSHRRQTRPLMRVGASSRRTAAGSSRMFTRGGGSRRGTRGRVESARGSWTTRRGDRWASVVAGSLRFQRRRERVSTDTVRVN